MAQHRLQLVQLPSRRVVTRDAGRSFKLCDHGIEWAVLPVLRAKVTQPDMLLTFQPTQQCLDQTRFANAGFARDQ